MMWGGGAAVGYGLLRELMRHHQDHIRRPKIIDHMIASCTIGTFVGVMNSGNMPLQTAMLYGFLVGGTLGLVYWWGSFVGMPGSHLRHAHIYYENDVKPEEVERYEAMD